MVFAAAAICHPNWRPETRSEFGDQILCSCLGHIGGIWTHAVVPTAIINQHGPPEENHLKEYTEIVGDVGLPSVWAVAKLYRCS